MHILILSGFLGSGKTSLLLALVKELQVRDKSMHIAILENDTGTVGIDTIVLENEGLQVRELTSGCVCCSLKGELLATALDIEKQIKPDLLIVEASGVAAPRLVADAFKEYPGKLSSITLAVLLDLTRLEVLSGYSSFYIQGCIESADFLLLNKMDAVETREITNAIAEVRTIRPDAILFPVSAVTGTGVPVIIHTLYEYMLGNETHTSYNEVLQDKLSDLVVCSREQSFKYPESMTGEAFTHVLSDMMVVMATDLKNAGCGLIGHLKMIVKGESGACLVRLVTFDGKPDIQNALGDALEHGELVINVLVYGGDQANIECIVDTRVAELCNF